MTQLLLALLAFAAPATAGDRRFPVEDFDRVIVEGPYSVHLVTGRPSNATGRGSRAALDRVAIDAQGMTLRIRRNREAWGASGDASTAGGPVEIELATRSLRSVRLIGPARFEAAGISGLAVELSVEGSGTLRVTGLAADSLSLALLGDGQFDLAGSAHILSVHLQGTGTLAAPNLVARSATLASSTSGAVTLTVNGPATVANNGLGNIRIYGRAVCTTSGASADQVQCGGAATAAASNQGQAR